MRSTNASIPKTPLQVKDEAIKRLSVLPQFLGVPDEALIRVAKRRTGLYVPNRWVAIALILGNRVPIPCAGGRARPRWQLGKLKPTTRLQLIQGGRIQQ
jgi:hypothetical protein